MFLVYFFFKLLKFFVVFYSLLEISVGSYFRCVHEERAIKEEKKILNPFDGAPPCRGGGALH
jgi:hypothetical protein